MSFDFSAGRRADREVAHDGDAYHWVVEGRAGEELRTFRSETHTTAGGE